MEGGTLRDVRPNTTGRFVRAVAGPAGDSGLRDRDMARLLAARPSRFSAHRLRAPTWAAARNWSEDWPVTSWSGSRLGPCHWHAGCPGRYLNHDFYRPGPVGAMAAEDQLERAALQRPRMSPPTRIHASARPQQSQDGQIFRFDHLNGDCLILRVHYDSATFALGQYKRDVGCQ